MKAQVQKNERKNAIDEIKVLVVTREDAYCPVCYSCRIERDRVGKRPARDEVAKACRDLDIRMTEDEIGDCSSRIMRGEPYWFGESRDGIYCFECIGV